MPRRRFLASTVGATVLTGAAPFVSLTTAAAATDPETGPADWPRFGYDLHNTRFNAREKQLGKANVGRLKPKWEFETGSPIQHTPAVVGNMLFFGTHGGDFYALDSRTGARRWHLKIGNAHPEHREFLKSSPEYSDGRLYFGSGRSDTPSNNAFVYCVDAASGRIIWRTQIDQNPENDTLVTSALAVFRGNVFGGTSGGSGYGQAFCLNAENGRVRWKFQTVPEIEYGGGGIWSSPAIDEEHGLVYNGTGDAKAFVTSGGPVLFSESLIANNADTGELRWFYQARPADEYYNLDFSCHPMLFDAAHARRPGAVRRCVGAGNKAGFFTVDRYTGEFYWKVMLTNHSHGSGLMLNCTAVAYNRVFAISNASGVRRRTPSSVTAGLNAYTGDIEWWVHNESTNQAPVAVANEVFYQGLMDGRLQAMDVATGEQLWEHKMPSGHRGGIAIANGALYTSNGAPFRSGEQEKYGVYCFTLDGA
jgi:glucose dehydrogenase